MGRRIEVDEQAMLDDLESMSYEAVGAKYGVSRGYIYRRAVEAQRRKNEARIKERTRERRRRQAEFLQEVINATCQTDVLAYLDGLPDASAQMVVTSPPYRLGKDYGEAQVDAARFSYYFGWMVQVFAEVARVLKPGGVFFLQMGNTRDKNERLYPMDALFLPHLLDTGLQLENRVIWQVPHGLTPARRLAGRYETALVLSKGDPAYFHANAARIPQKDPGKRAFKGDRVGELSGHPLGAHPIDVWQIPNVGHNNPEKTGHPAQMPVALAKRPILLYSRPGDLVVDPFAGSGTVCVAAAETGRAFSGADLFYEDMRAERLAAVQPDLVSVLPGVTDESVAVWQAEARRKDVAAMPLSPREERAQMDLIFGSQEAA